MSIGSGALTVLSLYYVSFPTPGVNQETALDQLYSAMYIDYNGISRWRVRCGLLLRVIGSPVSQVKG